MLDERLGKLAVLAHLRRLQPDLLPAAHARAARDAAADLHLPDDNGWWYTTTSLSSIGACIMCVGLLLFFVNVVLVASGAGRAPATTRGWGTRSSGTRPRRRRRTTSTASRTSRARGRCATCGGDWRKPVRELPPRPLAAADGARRRRRLRARRRLRGRGWDTAHRVLAALVAAAARCGRGRGAGRAPAAARAARSSRSRSSGRQPRLTARPSHVALAALALAAAAVSASLTFRGEHVASGPWRDYVTLTKPRIMSLLLLTGACGMFVGRGGVPPLGDLAVCSSALGSRVAARARSTM